MVKDIAQVEEERERFGHSPWGKEGVRDWADLSTHSVPRFDPAAIPHFNPRLIPRHTDTLIPKVMDALTFKRQSDVGRKQKRSRKSQQQYDLAMTMLCVHLWAAYTAHKDIPLSIGTDAKTFKNTYPNPITAFGYDALKDALGDLLAAGWVARYKNHSSLGDGRGKVAQFYAREPCLSRLCPLLSSCKSGDFQTAPHLDTIFLKDSKKAPKAFKDTHKVKAMRETLALINTETARHDIRLATHNIPTGSHGTYIHSVLSPTSLHRVFNNNDWRQGGRFYGGWWQYIKSRLRHFIEIDGEPVIEADYKSMHPTIIYAEAGQPMPEGFYDPAFNGCPHASRKHIKKAFNGLLNTSTTVQAPDDFDKAAAGMTWAQVLKNVEAAHKPIGHAFRTGKGLFLQRIDSDIAEIVLETFAKRGKACLPVHDSFIVKAGDAALLQDIMREAGKKIAGIDFKIDTKQPEPPQINTEPF